MIVHNIAIDEIKIYENNPRKNDQAVEGVKKSIKEFGFKVPMIITSDKVIIAGHTRLKAAQQLGYKEVPCVIADDLTEDQIRAFRIADNKTAETAEWDFELLKAELEGLEDMFTGFDEAETQEMFGEEVEVEEDDYEIELPSEPRAKLGDIYKLGNHRLMCGDSTQQDDVDKLMAKTVVDLVVTDPPYNVDYGSKAQAINQYGYNFSDRHIKNDYMPEYQFIEFLDKSFKNMSKYLKPGGVFYIWHASTTIFEFETALRYNNLKTRQQLIWNKNAIVLSRQDYHWKHEPVLYGWKEGAGHYFVDDRTQATVIEDMKPKYKSMKKEELVKLLDEIYSDKMSTTILNEDKPSISEEHPTMKPLKLLARLIKNSSKQEEIVQDLFGGSGSTLMACEQLNRKCYTMELDPKYVDVIIDRWEQYTGEKAVKL